MGIQTFSGVFKGCSTDPTSTRPPLNGTVCLADNLTHAINGQNYEWTTGATHLCPLQSATPPLLTSWQLTGWGVSLQGFIYAPTDQLVAQNTATYTSDW